MHSLTYEFNKLVRLATGFNQTEFCEKLNISREALNKYIHRSLEDFESEHKSTQYSIENIENKAKSVLNIDLRKIKKGAMLFIERRQNNV